MTHKPIFLSLALVVAAVSIGVSQGSGTGSLGGTIRSATGEAMHAVLVKAKDGAGMTVTVMSQRDGTYTIPDLRPGMYTVLAQRMGYAADPRSVTVTAGERVADVNATLSRMPNGTVSKNQLSNMDLHHVLPASRFKETMLGPTDRAGAGCELCHSFTGLVAQRDYNRARWVAGMNLMREKNFSRIDEADIPEFADYLQSAFGADATYVMEPENVDNISVNIRYVSYDLPAVNAMPHTAAPDLRGNVWSAEFGGNNIAKVNVATGIVEEFPTPPHDLTRAHGLAVSSDGTVWFTQQGSGYIGRFDPRQREMTEYRIPRSVHAEPAAPEMEGRPDASPHTIIVDLQDNVWFTGGSAGTRDTILKKFNRETEQFSEVVIKKTDGGSGGLYGVTVDPGTGYLWYAGIGINEVGYVNPATNEVTHFPMLSANSAPRRIKIDSKGIAWVNQTNTNKLARIDPETGTVTEYDIPGASTLYPYPTGIDAKDRIWVQTFRDDRLHMFDPETERFTTFLMPDKGNGLRDFFLDENGWLWAGVFGRNQIIGFKLLED